MSSRWCSFYRLVIFILIANMLWVVIAYFYLMSIPEGRGLRRTNVLLGSHHNSSLVYTIKGSHGAQLQSDCGVAPRKIDYMPGGTIVVAAYKNSTATRPGSVANIQVYFPVYGWLCQMEFIQSSDSNSIIYISPSLHSRDRSRKNHAMATSHLVSGGPAYDGEEGLDNRIRSNWIDQWPIGNGRVGALVGGSLFAEVVPLSIAGFYTVPSTQPHSEGSHPGGDRRRHYRRKTDSQSSPFGASGKGQSEEGSDSRAFLLFQKSRAQLLKGDVRSSTSLLGEAMDREPLGRFEYVCDLLLMYFPSPPLPTASTWSDISQPQDVSGGAASQSDSQRKGSPPRGESMPRLRGRADLLDEFLDTVLPLHTTPPPTQEKETHHDRTGSEGKHPQGPAKERERQRRRAGLADYGSVRHQRSFLDTITGTASSVFVAEAPVQDYGRRRGADATSANTGPASPTSRLHLHSREWLASEGSDVLVGTVRCVSVMEKVEERAEKGEEGGDAVGCLNVHLRMGREMRAPQGPPGATSPLNERHWQARPWIHRGSHSELDDVMSSFPSFSSQQQHLHRRGTGWFDVASPLLSGGRPPGVVVGGFDEPLPEGQLLAISFSMHPESRAPGKNSDNEGRGGHPSPHGPRQHDAGRTSAEGMLHPGVEVCGAVLCLHSVAVIGRGSMH